MSDLKRYEQGYDGIIEKENGFFVIADDALAAIKELEQKLSKSKLDEEISRTALDLAGEINTKIIDDLKIKLSDAEKQVKDYKTALEIMCDTSKRLGANVVELEDKLIEKQNEWISVENRLPISERLSTANTQYWVKKSNGQYEACYFLHSAWLSSNVEVKDVTHWKPITPPEVDKDE